MVKFEYDTERTRTICRACMNKYIDAVFVDISGGCDDCHVSTGHLGFTNMRKLKED